jgi:phage host-nuclease inhibitor protein Gam
MPNRKAVEPALKEWSDVDESLGHLCELDSRRQTVEAALNDELRGVREQYDSRLNALSIDSAALEAQVEQFCNAHRDDFGQKKSVERLHAILSFRTSPPAVKALNRKWTADAILAAVVKHLPRFVRLKKEVARDTILGDYAAKKITDADLGEVGLQVVQDETFGIELKREQAPEAIQA